MSSILEAEITIWCCSPLQSPYLPTALDCPQLNKSQAARLNFRSIKLNPSKKRSTRVLDSRGALAESRLSTLLANPHYPNPARQPSALTTSLRTPAHRPSSTPPSPHNHPACPPRASHKKKSTNTGPSSPRSPMEANTSRAHRQPTSSRTRG